METLETNRKPKKPQSYFSIIVEKNIYNNIMLWKQKKMPKMPKMETFGNEKMPKNKFFKYKNNLLFNSINTK